MLAHGIEEFPGARGAGELVCAELNRITILSAGRQNQETEAKHDTDHADERDCTDV